MLLADVKEEPSEVLHATDLLSCDKGSKPRSVCARFPGSREMNTHGKHDILRYMIPGEDKCYIFLFKRANQGYDIYTCRGCSRLKTPVTVKVIGDDFLSDPCQEPHRCVPVDALNEKVERLAYMRMCNLNRRLKRILVTKSSLAVPESDYVKWRMLTERTPQRESKSRQDEDWIDQGICSYFYGSTIFMGKEDRMPFDFMLDDVQDAGKLLLFFVRVVLECGMIEP
ncbi:unnamed protein product [Nippostrongylus brasiliensis]|uniref:Uncharacterized protein n=1 Tax=Nippostrongylus brasiliensis TaxID=27835 RepID=A0A0N4XZN8_NIPBR|nr:unnamed protein product [Nippostrongylus brasiliensis]